MEQAEFERMEEERHAEEEERMAQEAEEHAMREEERRRRRRPDEEEEPPQRGYGPGRLYAQATDFEQPSPRQRRRNQLDVQQPTVFTSNSLPQGSYGCALFCVDNKSNADKVYSAPNAVPQASERSLARQKGQMLNALVQILPDPSTCQSNSLRRK